MVNSLEWDWLRPNASRVHGIMDEIWNKRRVLRLFFFEDAWMILLQLPGFSSRWYFKWEGTLDTAEDQAGLAGGGRVILLWVF